MEQTQAQVIHHLFFTPSITTLHNEKGSKTTRDAAQWTNGEVKFNIFPTQCPLADSGSVIHSTQQSSKKY